MIFVIGAFPDSLNSNIYIRDYIVDGFREASTGLDVWSLGPDQFMKLETLPSRSVCLFVGSVLSDRSPTEIYLAKARRLGARVGVWLHDDPYEFDASGRVYDAAHVIFTNDRASLYHYPDQSRVFHLPLASSSNFLDLPAKRGWMDYLFAGVPFSNRKEYFERFSSLNVANGKTLNGVLIGPSWELSKFEDAIDRRLTANSLTLFYKEAKSVIYLGRDLDLCNRRFRIRPSTPGPRLFECAGAGGCQVAMTPGLEIMDYFEPGKEFFLAESVEESFDIVLMLKKDVQLSLEIGSMAQKRVKSEHLYKHRALKILSIMENI